jgi:hypothetical protein
MAELASIHLDPQLYADLQAKLTEFGPAAAAQWLIEQLRQHDDLPNLFSALLLSKRLELNLPLLPGPQAEIPEAVRADYDEAIRAACREVGERYLQRNDPVQAWPYFRLLGLTEPIREALERFEPEEGSDLEPIINLALHTGLHPRRGFDLVLQRYGICSAITMVSTHDFGNDSATRHYCIGRLVRALHTQLGERLSQEIANREGVKPQWHSLRELIAGRDWLFGDEYYHVDISHLSSIVQMSLSLPPGPELDLACELCEFGARLPKQFQHSGDPPFADFYPDHRRYLEVLANRDVEANLAHFYQSLPAPDSEETYPAQVLVNLLVQINRLPEALRVARDYLSKSNPQELSCPGPLELAQRLGDFATLSETAKERHDPVHYLAALITAQQQPRT